MTTINATNKTLNLTLKFLWEYCLILADNCNVGRARKWDADIDGVGRKSMLSKRYWNSSDCTQRSISNDFHTTNQPRIALH